MMSDLNRPLQESYAATVPALSEVQSAPPPKPVDMSVDMSKIQDPIEILEMALKDKAQEEPPLAPASTAPITNTVVTSDASAISIAPAPPAPINTVADTPAAQLPCEPTQQVTEYTQVTVPTPAPTPAPEPISQPAPAPKTAATPLVPVNCSSKSDISSFMGQGPIGWKSIKPPGMKA